MSQRNHRIQSEEMVTVTETHGLGWRAAWGGIYIHIHPLRSILCRVSILAPALISTASHLISHPLFIPIFSQSHPFTPPLNINIWFRALSPKVALSSTSRLEFSLFFHRLSNCVLPDSATGPMLVLQSDPAFLKCSGGDVTQSYDACARVSWTYFSPPRCPAGLFDLPHHCSHQEQRQKTTGTQESKCQRWLSPNVGTRVGQMTKCEEAS